MSKSKYPIKFPIKYIENNIVLNHDNECYAYFELSAYNYSFLSLDEKVQTQVNLMRLLSLVSSGKIHMLHISTESSRREIAERSKRHVSGNLKQVAYDRIDALTEAIIDQYGESQIDYRYFVGFKLTLNDQEFSFQNVLQELSNGVHDFIGEVNHKVMNDYVTMRNTDMARYSQLEGTLFSRLSNLFEVRRVTPTDLGYITEHIYGKSGVAYEDYQFDLKHTQTKKETQVKQYDLLRLGRVEMQEGRRYVRISDGEYETYAAYMPMERVIDGIYFPGCEMLYQHELQFPFPVDTSINIEVLDNKKALSTVRNKKKELKDLDNHAYQSDNETTQNIVEARELADELESDLSVTKESMYRFSYVVRVLAPTLDTLKERCDLVRDTYDSFKIKLVRPLGDMMGLHCEFVPSGKRYLKDYVQTETCEFLASLGFGASQVLGERDGILIGFLSQPGLMDEHGRVAHSGRAVYIRPELAAQGVAGSDTNALAISLTGSLGGGKSQSANELIYYSVIYGGKALIIDPKSERGGWYDALPELRSEMNIVNLTSDSANQGLLDPFVIMPNIKDAEKIALDVLGYLTGTRIQDVSDRYTLLRKAVRNVCEYEQRGLLYVIDELKMMNSPVATQLAEHIDSYRDLSFAQLLFSRGDVRNSINLSKQLNIIQVADLTLPDSEADASEYTASEILSVGMLHVISAFAMNYIQSDRSVYKILALDEAWSLLRDGRGKELSNKVSRAGRSMNAGVFFITQNCDDVRKDGIENTVGQRFAFRSRDRSEVEKILNYFDLDTESEENQDALKSLQNGQCLFRDLYGHVGVVYFDPIFQDLKDAFDTRPPERIEQDE